MPKDESKVAAAVARKESLTPSRRAEIARKAAEVRWEGTTPKATHEGEFDLGGQTVSCAVLPNGTRLITQATFLRALGRSRSPKAGTGVLVTADEQLPFFLQAKALQPFIDEELAMSTNPIFYRTVSGGRGVGFDARLLPKVAEVYLRYRDARLEDGKSLGQYEPIVKSADILMRGLANVGIVALVDEATGFERDRAKGALAKILEEFIAKELQPYVSTFPVEYYQELFRLRGKEWTSASVKRPQYFGTLTNDIVYRRLAPGVLEELKKVTPKGATGKNKAKLFQSLTTNQGYPKLLGHLGKVVAFMQISDTYKEFIEVLDKKLPRYPKQPQTQTQMELDLDYNPKSDSGEGI